MNHDDENERWLDVLAGRLSADQPALRQAAVLRSEFERMALTENEMTNNPEGEARLMKFLRDSGTFDEPTAAAATTMPTSRPAARQAAPARPSGLLATLAAARDWLLPPGAGHAGRYALVAAIALAVVAGPLLLNRAAAPDDATTIKSAPQLGPDAGQTIVSRQPDEAAARVVARLSALGISTRVTPDGDDRQISATVPAASIAAARQGLAAEGLSLPADGELDVRVRKAP